MLTAGPFSTLPSAEGLHVPLYLISFDEEGKCTSPQMLEALHADARSGKYSDIHIYSHGWNNVFQEALRHYTDFFTEYFELRRKQKMPAEHYRPLLVGIIWPSTAFLSDDEVGPRIAADFSQPFEPLTGKEQVALKELAKTVRAEDAPRLTRLLSRNLPFSHDDALEAAVILLPVFRRESRDGEGIPQDVVPEKLVNIWEETSTARSQQENVGEPGILPDEDEAGPQDAPATAGILDFLDPRKILRIATVYLMKDRAGIVGRRGVGPLLHYLLAQTSVQVRVHLTGHSFGAKVMLSALTSMEHPRRIRSVLLLQPAVNAFCFAERIQEIGGRPGVYRPALTRTEMPICSTFSRHDVPLTRFFHLALRRDRDIGEVWTAGGPTSIFAALGGFGPGGMADGESTTLPMQAPPYKYPLSDPAVRFCTLDGSDNRITSHGDVRNVYTEWVMVNLVSGGDLLWTTH